MQDHQHKPTKSGEVAQLNLLPPPKTNPPPDLAYLLALPTFRRVVRYAMSLPDLTPKQVYEPLGKDKGTWSRIESGDMSFQVDDIEKFCETVGNDAVVLWLADRAGYDVATMRKKRTDLEKQLAAEKERADAAEYKLAVAIELIGARK